jgi:hypothetical protein
VFEISRRPGNISKNCAILNSRGFAPRRNIPVARKGQKWPSPTGRSWASRSRRSTPAAARFNITPLHPPRTENQEPITDPKSHSLLETAQLKYVQCQIGPEEASQIPQFAIQIRAQSNSARHNRSTQGQKRLPLYQGKQFAERPQKAPIQATVPRTYYLDSCPCESAQPSADK